MHILFSRFPTVWLHCRLTAEILSYQGPDRTKNGDISRMGHLNGIAGLLFYHAGFCL